MAAPMPRLPPVTRARLFFGLSVIMNWILRLKNWSGAAHETAFEHQSGGKCDPKMNQEQRGENKSHPPDPELAVAFQVKTIFRAERGDRQEHPQQTVTSPKESAAKILEHG